MRIVTRYSIIIATALVLVGGCDRTDSDWSKAKRDATASSYQNYLVRHPNSVHDVEARATLKKLEFTDLMSRLGLHATDNGNGTILVSNLFPQKDERYKFGHPVTIHITDVIDDSFQTTGDVPSVGFDAIGVTWVFDRAGIKFSANNCVVQSTTAGASLTFEDEGELLRGLNILPRK